jgi:hypothetical protein
MIGDRGILSIWDIQKPHFGKIANRTNFTVASIETNKAIMADKWLYNQDKSDPIYLVIQTWFMPQFLSDVKLPRKIYAPNPYKYHIIKTSEDITVYVILNRINKYLSNVIKVDKNSYTTKRLSSVEAELLTNKPEDALKLI